MRRKLKAVKAFSLLYLFFVRSCESLSRFGGFAERSQIRAKTKTTAHFLASTLRGKFLELSPHDGGASIDSSPILDANNTLVNEHAEPINNRATARFGVFDEVGTRWVRNNIGYYHA